MLTEWMAAMRPVYPALVAYGRCAVGVLVMQADQPLKVIASR
jgi:hypothetical protein